MKVLDACFIHQIQLTAMNKSRKTEQNEGRWNQTLTTNFSRAEYIKLLHEYLHVEKYATYIYDSCTMKCYNDVQWKTTQNICLLFLQ